MTWAQEDLFSMLVFLVVSCILPMPRTCSSGWTCVSDKARPQDPLAYALVPHEPSSKLPNTAGCLVKEYREALPSFTKGGICLHLTPSSTLGLTPAGAQSTRAVGGGDPAAPAAWKGRDTGRLLRHGAWGSS